MQKTLAILMHQPVLPISNRVNAVYNLHTQGVLKLEGILGELLMGVGEASIISGSHKNWGFSNIFHCIILNLHKSGSSLWRRKRLIMVGKEGERATGWPAPEGRHCVCFISASLWPLATDLHQTIWVLGVIQVHLSRCDSLAHERKGKNSASTRLY